MLVSMTPFHLTRGIHASAILKQESQKGELSSMGGCYASVFGGTMTETEGSEREGKR